MITEGWKIEGFKIREIANELYLINYTLYGQGRITKRGEIWQGNIEKGLKIMYHQGTIVVPERVEEHKKLEKELTRSK